MYREPGQRDAETYYSYAKRSGRARVWIAFALAMAPLAVLVWGVLARDLTFVLAGALGIFASIAAMTILGMRAKKGDFVTTRIEPGPTRVEISGEPQNEEAEARSDRKRSAR